MKKKSPSIVPRRLSHRVPVQLTEPGDRMSAFRLAYNVFKLLYWPLEICESRPKLQFDGYAMPNRACWSDGLGTT